MFINKFIGWYKHFFIYRQFKVEVTILIPAKNEKFNLPIVLDEIFNTIDFSFQYEILVIVPKNDNSLENLTDKHRKKIIIHEQKTNGYGSAMIEGSNLVNGKNIIFVSQMAHLIQKILEEFMINLKTMILFIVQDIAKVPKAMMIQF